MGVKHRLTLGNKGIGLVVLQRSAEGQDSGAAVMWDHGITELGSDKSLMLEFTELIKTESG